MLYSSLVLAALSAVASAQQTYSVLVGANKTLTFSPDNVVAPVGSVVQFQFVGGNHTASQSTFAQPCSPIGLNSNVTGFHSGFMPVAASQSSGMGPVFSVMITNTSPIWVYCAQAKHCESGMSMVINENTSSNKTLDAYKAAASSVSQTVIPSNVSSSDDSASTTTAGSGNAGATTKAGGATALGVSSVLGLVAVAMALALA